MLGFLSRNYYTVWPETPAKDTDALKIGILGAAQIAPLALINPSRSHPGVIVEGIAARDIKRAQAFATKYGVNRVFKSYQALLDDPDIDVVYNPLPNSLHYEWTMKALNAGKHVLLEKPSGDTAEETSNMFALAKEKNLILLEAFHYRFHPATQTVRAMVESGIIGEVTGADAELAFPNIFADSDIRKNLKLGGGACMDAGCYTINAIRYVLNSEPKDILKIAVNEYPDFPKVDRSLRAIFDMGGDVTASIYVDHSMPKRSLLGPTPFLRVVPRLPIMTIKIFGTQGDIFLDNFVASSVWHSITLTKDGKSETIKAYTAEKLSADKPGKEWWTSYRYQLEAFVDQVKGRTPQHWITPEDSIENMKVLESVYEASGLGARPESSYLGQH